MSEASSWRLGEWQRLALKVFLAPYRVLRQLYCHWWEDRTGYQRSEFCLFYIPVSHVACNLNKHLAWLLCITPHPACGLLLLPASPLLLFSTSAWQGPWGPWLWVYENKPQEQPQGNFSADKQAIFEVIFWDTATIFFTNLKLLERTGESKHRGWQTKPPHQQMSCSCPFAGRNFQSCPDYPSQILQLCTLKNIVGKCLKMEKKSEAQTGRSILLAWKWRVDKMLIFGGVILKATILKAG